MNKKFHGKCYYMDLNDWDEVEKVCDLIKACDVLKDEKFHILIPECNEGFVVYFEAPLETFRGPKYHSWEKIKATIYRNRRIGD